ncbi:MULTISPECIES: MFS transporter [unclassified Stenotrophomonas]|uniref:MFS transporter n=1 Tax=unclassified Stenotrophomonas TaxID=196198 RepID=UPI002118DB62|nr:MULTISPECIES: MFS transporter [unclassified Stenotrophomonas]
MPAAIYVFSLCAFAFGLSEFVVAGLLTAIADDLDAPISLVGTAIAAYALGAAIGAPFITALVAHWRDRHILLLATALLGVGSLLMSASPNLVVLLAVRFVVGLGHGVFMAVASDAATRLVDPQRSGRALSVVWIGLTLALAIGVPLGTYLGSLWSWRVIFMAIGVLSAGGMLGLALCMPRGEAEAGSTGGGAWKGIKAIAHPQLLITAGIGALVSVATFSFFTFVSPYLQQVTAVGVQWLSLGMLLFGICAIAGNLLGGFLADATDVDRSIRLALVALALNLLGLYGVASLPVPMMLLIGTLGICFFAIVTLLTLRLLRQAQRFIPAYSSVAAGLNIASFNLGTALGGALGGLTISYASLASIPLTGASAAVIAVMALYLQMRRQGELESSVP